MFSSEVYVTTAPREIVLPMLADDGSNKGDFYGVDTLTQKKFAQNYGGYPRSDIAMINEQKNIMVARQMLENLPDFGSSSNPNANKTDVEVMKGVTSKYMQSPSEIIPYIESQIGLRNEKIAADAVRKAQLEAEASALQSQMDAEDAARRAHAAVDNV